MRRICIFTAVFDVIQITDSNTKNEKKVLYNKKKKKKNWRVKKRSRLEMLH